ncbi:MAG: condensation domain-containing protein, partial [Bacteroidota bacterium]
LETKQNYIERLKKSIEKSKKESRNGNYYNNKSNFLSYRKKIDLDIKRVIHNKGLKNEYNLKDIYGVVGEINITGGSSYSFTIEDKLFDKIKSISNRLNTSVFITIISIYLVLFYKTTGFKNYRLAVVKSRRVYKEFERVLGWLSCDVIMCFELLESLSFTSLSRIVTDELLSFPEKVFFNYEKIINELDCPLSVLSPYLFNYYQKKDRSIKNCIAAGHETNGFGQFDFYAIIEHYNDGLYFKINYNMEAYDKKQIQRIANMFISLVNQISDNDDLEIINYLLNTKDR